MDEENTYPVFGRLRHNGTLYAPSTTNGTVDLTELEAKPLLALKVIGEANDIDGEDEAPFDLVVALTQLRTDGHDIVNLKMNDIGKLLGRNVRGVTRRGVNAALELIAEADKLT
jgi:hypothetical protein